MIVLTRGQSAIVDEDDYEQVVAAGPWHAQQARSTAPWYAVHSITSTSNIAMHNLLTGWKRVDHIDRNGLNNCRNNLRPADAMLNAANRRGWSKHGYKGVFRQTNGRWAARAANSGKKYLGTFDTLEEAAMAYDTAAFDLYGEYALLNFPRR